MHSIREQTLDKRKGHIPADIFRHHTNGQQEVRDLTVVAREAPLVGLLGGLFQSSAMLRNTPALMPPAKPRRRS